MILAYFSHQSVTSFLSFTIIETLERQNFLNQVNKSIQTKSMLINYLTKFLSLFLLSLKFYNIDQFSAMGHRLNDSTIWPFPVYQGIPLKNMLLSFNPSQVPFYTFSQQLVNYLLQICHIKRYSPKSFQSTLRILSRYVQKTNKIHSLQLISLVSLMLATKFYEYYYFTVPEIHEMSNHEFTNKGNCLFMSEDIHEMEELILLTLEFNLFIEPIKHDSTQKMLKKGQFGHASVYEMLLVAMEMVCIIIPEDKRSRFYEHTNNIFILYFHMLFTRDIKKPVLSKLCDPKTIICMVLNMSLIVMTQSKGDFPQILWIKQVLGLNQSKDENGKDLDDEFDQMLMRVMEVLLGSEMKEIKNGLKQFWIKK